MISVIYFFIFVEKLNKMKKYPKSIIILHWLTLILFVTVFVLGVSMENYKFNAENFNHYRAHALLGMLIMILTIIRLFVKQKHKNDLPPEITYYSKGHKLLVKTVQNLIYVLLIITPLVGFVMVYQTGALQYDLGGPFPEGATFDEGMEILHKSLVFTLTGLIVIHAAGIVIYKMKTGENLLKRMCLLIK